MSFVNRYIKSVKSSYMRLVLAKTKDGLNAWWYVLVDNSKINKFDKAMKVGNVDLSDFGKIIKSGYGKEPSAITKEEIKELYNFSE